jgi:CelD/BcsL family acetyltransferase involved in cellulose biosynthesis
MKIHHLPARRLTDELASHWCEILRKTPQLAGPFFRPEFTVAVASVRDDVEVAVLEEGGEILGCFPYQRTRWNVAQPVGGPLAGFHGVIAEPEVYWLPGEILAACKLSAWEFNQQLAWQTPLAPYFSHRAASPVMDVSGGYELWLESRVAASAPLAQTLDWVHQLHEQSHSLEFTWHTTDAAMFEQFLAWCLPANGKTGCDNLFRQQWVVALLEMLRQAEGPNLRGILSALRVDGRAVAIHFALQANSILHSWFAAHDPDQIAGRAGQILQLQIAQHAADHGVQRIHLGHGDRDYRQWFATDVIEVAAGCYDRRPFAAAIRKGWAATRDWVGSSTLRETAQLPTRLIGPLRHWLASDARCT